MKKLVKVAMVQFHLKRIRSEDEFWKRIEKFVSQAKLRGASVILLPEYFVIPLLIFKTRSTFKIGLTKFSDIATGFHFRLQALADKNKIIIVAGTTPYLIKQKMVNRCFIYTPKNKVRFQDKQNMTRFEKEKWHINPGANIITTFKCKSVTFGIAICFDVEFSSYVKKLARANVDVILVPSCTDDIHGYWRVRHCAEARAIEYQSYVVLGAIIGGDKNNPEIKSHYGRAGVFSPCDVGFKVGGALLTGKVNREVVVVAELDISKLHSIRKKGTVLNRKLNLGK